MRTDSLRCRLRSRRYLTISLLLFSFAKASSLAHADEIVIPAGALSRNRPIDFVYRLDRPAKGEGVLALEWTDALGRIVERRDTALSFHDTTRAAFRMDLRRAVAMQNHLRAHLSFNGVTAAGAADRRENDAQASFVVRPIERRWSDYQIIMWQKRTAEQYAALRELGITAGTILANRGSEAADYMEKQYAPLLARDLRWYVENIATDFYSAYHRWSPDHPENWRFLQSKERYRTNPNDISAFIRDPSLSDPEWLQRIHDRLVATVRSQYAYRPLYYDLGDETGIADLSGYWDFDFSAQSLQAMRGWLRQHYRSLAALNAQWGSHFVRWDLVTPMTTREAMRRTDDNFSAWADFKAWMDVAFARALRMGTDAVHSADRDAYAAIEGTQIPGWGGYDYSRLAFAVDAMELYDFGGNIDIVRSLNPKLAVLTTSTAGGPKEAHRVWRELLRGSRGLILWDPDNAIVREDGSLGDSGRQAASYFGEIRHGLGALLLNSRRQTDPIAILYSPASMRTQWMLDQIPKGEVWTERDAEAEYQDNAVRAANRFYAGLVEHLGLQYRFVSSEMIEHGELSRRHYKVLMLPHAVSLSSAEALEIRGFVHRGGMLITDSEPGTFDEHSRRLMRSLLSDVLRDAPKDEATTIAFGRGKVSYFPLGPHDLGADLTACADAKILARMTRLFSSPGLKPVFSVTGTTGDAPTDVHAYVFRNGGVTILALHRDVCTSSVGSEPVQQGSSSSPNARIRLTLPHRSFVYDVRTERSLGSVDHLELRLDPIEPTILSFSDAPIPSPRISGPKRVRLGGIADFRLDLSGATPSAAIHVLHVEAMNPAGKVVSYYSGNVLVPQGSASVRLPLALNDTPGTWRVRATDILNGSVTTRELQVLER